MGLDKSKRLLAFSAPNIEEKYKLEMYNVYVNNDVHYASSLVLGNKHPTERAKLYLLTKSNLSDIKSEELDETIIAMSNNLKRLTKDLYDPLVKYYTTNNLNSAYKVFANHYPRDFDGDMNAETLSLYGELTDNTELMTNIVVTMINMYKEKHSGSSNRMFMTMKNFGNRFL
jgi:hypothetical protein